MFMWPPEVICFAIVCHAAVDSSESVLLVALSEWKTSKRNNNSALPCHLSLFSLSCFLNVCSFFVFIHVFVKRRRKKQMLNRTFVIPFFFWQSKYCISDFRASHNLFFFLSFFLCFFWCNFFFFFFFFFFLYVNTV